MPYTATNELPDGVRHALPAHAQAIYKEAFNSAYQEYKSAKDRKGALTVKSRHTKLPGVQSSTATAKVPTANGTG